MQTFWGRVCAFRFVGGAVQYRIYNIHTPGYPSYPAREDSGMGKDEQDPGVRHVARREAPAVHVRPPAQN